MDTKQVDTNSATELAIVRTREAADRTLLAWIRTSLALIGFGFTANKVISDLQAGKSVSPLHSTKNVPPIKVK
jgi:putative membrane protein